MSIERHEVGPRMSKVAVKGDTVYLAGQIAADPVPSVRGQTTQILAQIDALLKLAKTDKSNLLSATVILSDIRNYDEMNSVWDAWVVQGDTPPRAVFEGKLVNSKALLVIIVTASR
ncbi:MAG: RidA family protein [Alphaproteobacteria bacterium]|nr:RidA family protein [Alphaproteobacteria bacterium]